MTGRPVNQQRRDELLDAVVGYAIEHGLEEVTWRPLSSSLGVTPTTLVHRFGSKERMIEAVQRRLRERIIAETAASPDEDATLASSVRRVWERASDPARDGEFRLFFAVYGQALQAPDRFGDFLGHVIADSTGALRAAQGDDVDEDTATRTATIVIATIRGLLLDLLATGDRERIQAAADAFIASLETT
ncbi:MAG TPA: TetR/AcrR family transcriptional regulator [Lacisediminihabitans sp.]|uniref:TetR/AcrR family transcriptional regulator n=1 Tax=Lacisediminihabitans sp. TaxID=2787631 RepID=UPI002EDB8C1C